MKLATTTYLATLAFSLAAMAGCGASDDSQQRAGGSNGAAGATNAAPAAHVTCITHVLQQAYCDGDSLPPVNTYSCTDDQPAEACKNEPDDAHSYGSCSELLTTTRDIVAAASCAEWQAQGGANGGTGSGGAGGSGMPPAGGDGGAPSCGPVNVSTFKPSWHPPAATHRNVCTQSQLKSLYEACFGSSGSQAACSAVTDAAADAGGDCARCALSQDTDPTYSAVVSNTGFSWINSAGCIAATSVQDLSCAQAQQASDQCEMAACGACAATFDACAATADTAGCAAYASAAGCTKSIDSGASFCLETDFATAFVQIGMLFCGP